MLLARAQNAVGAVSGGVVLVAVVAPATGEPVTPLLPSYHWNVGSGNPLAATVRMVVRPYSTVLFATGCWVITGALPVIVRVRLAVAEAPRLLTVTGTATTPATVGVPLMMPLAASST